MTRYFFQLVTPSKSFADDRGEEFDTLAEAQEHASAVACELARNYSADDVAGQAVVVCDAAGAELLRVPLEAQPDDDTGSALNRQSGLH